MPQLIFFLLFIFNSLAIAGRYSTVRKSDAGHLHAGAHGLRTSKTGHVHHARATTSNCTNSASDRACWSDGFDITTNWYENVPDTGVTRTYYFNIENTTASPDGVEMPVQLINGSFPGPTIIADWGDTIVVHLTNSLENNGTGLHFHGVRQNRTSQNDGVPSMTQCPIAPGDSYTYTWRATEYGTGWYHSHFYVQAWDGVFGGILINGPATANYDVDLGHLFLNDWYHNTADYEAIVAETTGPPTAVNGLINGTNTYNSTLGSRFSTTFEAGVRYRIRLVNAAADNHFRFMIDDHELEVIATDFVPIVPYNTTDLSIGMGQRYDVIVTAKSITSGNYWIRAIPQTSCSDSSAVDNIKGIIRYDSSSTTDPTTSAYNYTDSCLDESASDLVPYVALNASSTYEYTDEYTVAVTASNNVIEWTMNSTSFRSAWSYPTLEQVSEGNDTWGTSQLVVQLPEADEWAYLLLYSAFAQDHPIHLHGHDFYVLGSGTGTFDASTDSSSLTVTNPPRRDVAMMPASGYLVIAFPTDNPGAWLMHCHIAWHTSEGFAIQFLERESEITVDSETLNSTCTNWKTYVSKDNITQSDSGV